MSSVAPAERTAVVYWPVSADPNIEIGLSRQLWGFPATRIRTGNRLAEFQRIQPGDLCVFARIDGGPRRSEGAWEISDLTFLYLAAVTWTEEDATTVVWPSTKGELYPYRVGIEIIEKRERVSADAVDDAWRRALRTSAFTGGSPVLLDGADPLSLFARPGTSADLKLDGPTDARVTTLRRLEQGSIRKAVLGNATSAPCSFCGRVFPVRHVRMAHVKQRSLCSDLERADWQNNIVVACVECDALFERGDIYVDPDGTIHAGAAATTPALDSVIARRAGRPCAGFTHASADYFAHRRAAHGH